MLVVVGHLISTIRTDSELGFGLYAYIYLFHMPAMILLSGVFAKPEVTPKAIKSSVQLVVLWLVWELIWAGLHGIFEQRPPGGSFLVSPAWTLWFLVSLVTMRILLPYIAQLKHPLIFSIAVSLIAPMFSAIGTEFSAARTLAFLPFFVAGWLIREREWLSGAWFTGTNGRARACGWAVLGGVALVFVVIAMLPGGFRGFWRIDKWLTHRDSYAWLFANAPLGEWAPDGAGVTGWIATAASGIAISAILMAVAAALTLAVLVVVPRTQSFITVWGARTLGIYLLHGVIVWVLRGLGVVDLFGELGPAGILGLVVVALGLTALLALAPVNRFFRPVLEPNIAWMYGKDRG